MVTTSQVAGQISRIARTSIRYAQCWEDADVLLAALEAAPGDVHLSIASGGDNTLSLLTQQPGRVIAVDMSAEQIACLELRASAYRCLSHPELLELVGAVPSKARAAYIERCWPLLSPESQRFWGAHAGLLRRWGLGHIGRLEYFMSLFRRWVLPLIHGPRRTDSLFQGRPAPERADFFYTVWNNFRWRTLIRVMLSQQVVGLLGRDPAFFTYAEEGLAPHLEKLIRRVLVEGNPAENHYASWMLRGTFGHTLPHALRAEHFNTIRDNLDRLEWHCASLEDVLGQPGLPAISRMNLSNIFEYLSEAQTEALLRRLVQAGQPGGRLVYWNMLVPRSRPPALADQLRPLQPLTEQLYQRNQIPFYSALVIEEIV